LIWELLHRKRLAYQRTFLAADGSPGPESDVVLRDLKRFCGINRGGLVVSPISRMTDSHATAYRAGQRDVYLRIVKYLGLDETALEDEHVSQASTDGA
jgi:hypothetical protein